MPRVLSAADVADFRERLCEAAERLFAEHGPAAVTMRQLAADLSVSPMTPYRYFKDKDDILAAVRTNGFNRFSDALEAAFTSVEGGRARGSAVGEAYLTFAFEHPATYKLMFDLDQPNEDQYPHLVEAAHRARDTQTQWVKSLISEGIFEGDPNEIGHLFWAATHGAVGLELAGKIPPGAARKLHRDLNHALARGLRP